MIDQKEAIKSVMNFLQDETKRILLVKGYDNDAKLRVVISCLERMFNKGIIRTGNMSDFSFLVNSAFKRKLLPNTIKSTTLYNLRKITVNINSYATHTKSNSKGNENTFTLFYPVESVLKDAKRYDKFLQEINKTESKKIILITTNEWGIINWDIENHVDQVFFYSVENDNPQIMINLRNNGAI